MNKEDIVPAQPYQAPANWMKDAWPIEGGAFWDIVEVDGNRMLRLVRGMNTNQLILVGLNEERGEIWDYIIESARNLRKLEEGRDK